MDGLENLKTVLWWGGLVVAAVVFPPLLLVVLAWYISRLTRGGD